MAICQSTRAAIERDPDTGTWCEVNPDHVIRVHRCQPVTITTVEVLPADHVGRCAYCQLPATLRIGGNDDACDQHVAAVIYDVTRVQVTV